MIYIFEDRQERKDIQTEKLKDFISDRIINFEQFKADKSVVDKVGEKFQDATCVIFHKSYIFSSDNVTFEEVQKAFLTPGRFCLFITYSGGIENSNVTKDGETVKTININADVMYKNLPAFLRHYQDTKAFECDILRWGENYKLTKILKFQYEVFQNFLLEKDLNSPIMSSNEISKFHRFIDKRLDNDIANQIKEQIPISATNHISWANVIDAIQSCITQKL